MRRRDWTFGLGALLLTLAVPGLLVAAPAFDEPRAAFGTLVGWGLALVIMVPSYVLLSRGLADGDGRGFVRGFMLGALLRLLATVVGVLVFALRVEQAPLRSFLLAFFLGYALLSALELVLTVPRTTRRASA